MKCAICACAGSYGQWVATCVCRCHRAATDDGIDSMGYWLREIGDSSSVAAAMYEAHGFRTMPLLNDRPIMHGDHTLVSGLGLQPPWQGNPVVASGQTVWRVYATASVALIIGDGYVVLDAGDTALVSLGRDHGGIPPTTTAASETVGGRRRAWFKVPAGRQARTGNVAHDVRALSRQDWVSVPPTRAPASGRRWRWESIVGAAPAPEWLLEPAAGTL